MQDKPITEEPKPGDVIILPQILLIGAKPGFYVVLQLAEETATLAMAEIGDEGIRPTERTISIPRDQLRRFHATTHRVAVDSVGRAAAPSASAEGERGFMAEGTTVRWGIIGAGSIARRFCEGVRALPDAELAAVGSRDPAKAEAFARDWGIPRAHAGYDSLVEDPQVDAVYVATTHNFHREHSLLALNAGKPVLCEKPFTINAAEAAEVIAVARQKRLFLMEAMWTRFFPAMYCVRDLIRSGAIGEPRMIQADFGFRAAVNPQGRLFNPELGGGALLDVGIYPVSLSSMVFGAPDRITGLATTGETGVDEQAGIVLGFPGGALAVLSTAIRTNTPHQAVIMGTEGRVTVMPPFWKPDRLSIVGNVQKVRGILDSQPPGAVGEIRQPDDNTVEAHLPYENGGFQFEIAESNRCIREGRLESEIMPLDETLSIMRTLDSLRSQWGLKYPGEA